MDLIKEYFKAVGYSILGLVFAFASFYLLANLYHYLEIRKDFIANFKEQVVVVNMEDSLRKIKYNISKFNINNYKGSVSATKMSTIKSNIESCLSNIENEEYNKLKESTRINILDVYRLRESYEDKVYNNCIVSNLYWLTTEAPGKYLKDNQALTKYYFDSLKSATSYLKKDLINNSSYFYNTSISSASIKDNTKDGYYDVMDAYTKATNFVLYLSDWFRLEAEGYYND